MAFGNSNGEIKLKVRCELPVRIIRNESRGIYEAFQDDLDILAYGNTPANAREELIKTIESVILAEYEYGYLDQMEEVREGQIDLVITKDEIILRAKKKD